MEPPTLSKSSWVYHTTKIPGDHSLKTYKLILTWLIFLQHDQVCSTHQYNGTHLTSGSTLSFWGSSIVTQECAYLYDAIFPTCNQPCMLVICTGLWVNKILFMPDRILAISVMEKLSLVITLYISEDGCSGSDMSSKMAYKGLP